MVGLTLIMCLVGLFSLILMAEFVEPKIVNIIELENKVEQRVIIVGQVIRVTQKPTVNFFDIKDQTSDVTIVAFGKMDKISKGANVNVRGSVEIYEGELEVIADQIEVLI